MEKLPSKNLAFGEILSAWRKRRRFSQLGFGLSVDVSSRHLSFLETGRASPSREMVLKLAGRLEMPMGEVNRALLAAGFAPAYVERSDNDQDLLPLKRAMKKLLENHMPYPALCLDSEWNLADMNPAAMKLLGDAGFGGSNNLLQVLAEQPKKSSAIINWDETIGMALERVRVELDAIGGNVRLEELEKKLTERFVKDGSDLDFDRSQAVIPTKFNIKGKIISIFSTIAQFGTVQDLALGDLKVELMFPLDKVCEEYFADET